MTDPRAALPDDTASSNDLPDYAMTTDEGNLAVDRLVRGLATTIDSGELERGEAVVALADGVQEISASHPEVTDITVRTAVLRELGPAFSRAGWQIPEPFEF